MLYVDERADGSTQLLFQKSYEYVTNLKREGKIGKKNDEIRKVIEVKHNNSNLLIFHDDIL